MFLNDPNLPPLMKPESMPVDPQQLAAQQAKQKLMRAMMFQQMGKALQGMGNRPVSFGSTRPRPQFNPYGQPMNGGY